MPGTYEAYPVHDIYSDGICKVENLGNCVRIVYFTYARGMGFGERRLIVAKMVRPISSILSTHEFMAMVEKEPILGMLPERNGH